MEANLSTFWSGWLYIAAVTTLTLGGGGFRMLAGASVMVALVAHLVVSSLVFRALVWRWRRQLDLEAFRNLFGNRQQQVVS